MTDEVRFALQLSLNVVAVLLAGWLAGRYAAHRVQRILEAERQRAEEARRQLQARLPSVSPELEQIAEVERWVLAARELQLVLTSLSTLVRVCLRTDDVTRRGVLTEMDRSLKFLGRQENKWLNASLSVITCVRQVDPTAGKAYDQSLETWISRLNRAHLQAAQSLRRAASLCDPEGNEGYSDTLTNAYLNEADQATADMSGIIASALDRVAYLKKQLPERQAQQTATAVDERLPGAPYVSEENNSEG